jgi:K+-transporting ATPase A subunit
VLSNRLLHCSGVPGHTNFMHGCVDIRGIGLNLFAHALQEIRNGDGAGVQDIPSFLCMASSDVLGLLT